MLGITIMCAICAAGIITLIEADKPGKKKEEEK